MASVSAESVGSCASPTASTSASSPAVKKMAPLKGAYPFSLFWTLRDCDMLTEGRNHDHFRLPESLCSKPFEVKLGSANTASFRLVIDRSLTVRLMCVSTPGPLVTSVEVLFGDQKAATDQLSFTTDVVQRVGAAQTKDVRKKLRTALLKASEEPKHEVLIMLTGEAMLIGKPATGAAPSTTSQQITEMVTSPCNINWQINFDVALTHASSGYFSVGAENDRTAWRVCFDACSGMPRLLLVLKGAVTAKTVCYRLDLEVTNLKSHASAKQNLFGLLDFCGGAISTGPELAAIVESALKAKEPCAVTYKGLVGTGWATRLKSAGFGEDDAEPADGFPLDRTADNTPFPHLQRAIDTDIFENYSHEIKGDMEIRTRDIGGSPAHSTSSKARIS